MSTTSVPRLAAEQAPGCEECLVELQPAGRGDHRYWTCHYCGTTVPR
jgi:tRNA(Ile2) C34 agmatinyltransferase TiaS